MRFLTFAAVAALLAPVTCNHAKAAPVRGIESDTQLTIDNAILSVRYSQKDGTFTVQRGPRQFIKPGRFPESQPQTRARIETCSSALGRGKRIELAFASGRVYRLALYEGLPFVVFGVFVEDSAEPVQIETMTAAILTIEPGKPPAALRVLGCDGLTVAGKDRTSYMFLAAAEPQTTAGVVCGWLTQDRGSGIVQSRTEAGLLKVLVRIEYGRLQVGPGKKMQPELAVAGYFDNAAEGLEAYADAIAKVYDIKLPAIPSGYCTWYSSPYGGASDEQHMAELADFCRANLAKFGLDTLQIDDRWQISGRDFTTHKPNGPYPSGMKATAEKINAAGMRAGLWFIPFGWDHKRPIFADHQDWFVHRSDGSIYSVHWAGDCLDMTHPGARDFLAKAVRRVTRQWGYKYIKIDGLWSGMAVKILYPQPTYRPDGLGEAVFHDPDKTNVEAYRDGLRLVRKAAGKDVYILGCNIAQNMRTLGGSVGLVDGMRIGSDTGARWGGIMRGALMGTRLYFLHNRVWHNDPDCLMLRSPLTLDQARAWGTWIGINGQLNMVSEWLAALPAERLEVLKRSIPNHHLTARPIDLFENDPARIWHLRAGQGEQRTDVVGLFNWDQKAAVPVTVELAKLGLEDAGDGFIGFDFWAGEFIGPFKDALRCDLKPSSGRSIAVRKVLARPVLVSTSRHVTQGIIDVSDERWDAKRLTLSGISRLVGGDPYEMRIFAPAQQWKIDSVVLDKSSSKAGIKAKAKQQGQEIRVTIDSPKNKEVAWKIRFTQEVQG